MSCDDIGGAVDAFDEQQIPADIRDAGTAAGVGDRVGGGDSVDTGDSFIAAIAIRPDSDRRSIRGETYTPTTQFRGC